MASTIRFCLIAATVSLALLSNRTLAQPTLAIALVPKVSINAQPGTVSAIQYSTNLSDPNSWVTLTTVRVTQSPLDYIDPTPATLPQRYYRAMTVSTNPGPIDLVWISPGTFTMGSPTNEPGSYSNEGPLTRVTLTRGFWVARFETSNQDWTNVMGGTTTSPLVPPRVSWVAAVNYCAALTDRERAAGRLPDGYVYRLPAEAEWEYACRAGTTTRFSFGDDFVEGQISNYAWWPGNSGGALHPVGQKLPNPWGLYDIHGNAAEWCYDAYSGALPGGSVTNPVVDFATALSVLRGGTPLADFASDLRSARRYGLDYNSMYYGFRVVLGPKL